MVLSSTTESVKAFVRVTDERQTHTGFLSTGSVSLRAELSAGVSLWNLVDREILSVDCGLQLRFEWCADFTELVPDYTAEKGVLFDIRSATDAAETVGRVANKARNISQTYE